MAEKLSDYKSRGVSPTQTTPTLTPIAEEAGDKVPKLSFRQSVEALPKHEHKAIAKYLPENIKGLSTRKQLKILDAAIQDNNIAAVKILAECVVNIKHVPLMDCCRRGQTEIVKILLINGANPNFVRKGDWSPLVCCVIAPYPDKVDLTPNLLACAKLLLDHGADVNWKADSTKLTPLHFAGGNKNPEFAALLLSRGADPLAKDSGFERPMLRLHHFRSLDVPTALQQGKQSQVDRWLTAVEKFLPHPDAASLLIEWVALCSSDLELTKKIHEAIALYLDKLKGEPPADVADYVTKYNAWVEEQEGQDKQEKIMNELAAEGLVSRGTGKEFRIEGKKYSLQKHGPLLMQLASFWADQKGNHMDHVVGILQFAAKSARDQQAPQDVRDELYADVKTLRNRLEKSSDPGRVKAIDSFLNPFN
jgi:Ankyrin repeats (3 copies)